MQPDRLGKVLLGPVDVSQPQQGIDAVWVDRQRLFEEGDRLHRAPGHECMGAVTVEGVHLFFPAHQPIAPPVQNDMRRLLQANGKRNKDGAGGHGNQDQGDGAEVEFSRRAGVDDDGAGIKFAEIAVDEDAGADEEDGDQQSEHGLDRFLRGGSPDDDPPLRRGDGSGRLLGKRDLFCVTPQPF